MAAYYSSVLRVLKHANKFSYKLIFFIIICIAIWAWNFYYSLYKKPLISADGRSILFTIQQNTSAKIIVNKLQQLHLLRSATNLLIFIRLNGYSKRLQAGTYEIHPNESVVALLNKIISGDVLQEKFTIIAGSTLSDMIDNLSHAPYLSIKFLDVNLNIILHENKYAQTAEGLFLADTYYYNANINALQILRNANHNLSNYLSNIWKYRAKNLPYKNSYQLLIAASIIEKEAADFMERRIIAGIIINRLTQHMRLQMDPTVIYALHKNYKQKLSHQDLNIDSKHNTYCYLGLPPTPIAMVSKDAIYAAANPQQTDYLYFYAKGDGSHKFSKTYTQQRQTIHNFKSVKVKTE